MGSASSVKTEPGIREPNRLNHIRIEEEIFEQKKTFSKVMKLLILGIAESGKSTFAKQMKLLHGGGFTESERGTYKYPINCNAVNSLANILRAMPLLEINFHDQSRQADSEYVLRHESLVMSGNMFLDVCHELAATMSRLWQDDGVQRCYEHRQEYQLIDSAAYFLDNLDRLSRNNYIPTDTDVLHCRLQTTGVIETTFNFKDQIFRMVDVGGQRSQRKKWIHCFDDVTAIIFTVGLGDYDLVLNEDSGINRLKESLTVFTSIINYYIFAQTAMILFLNKSDIFVDKLRTSPLSHYLPDYEGNSVEEAKNYIRQKFVNCGPKGKDIFTHFTVATNTRNIDFVFDAAMTIILHKNLNETGMLF